MIELRKNGVRVLSFTSRQAAEIVRDRIVETERLANCAGAPSYGYTIDEVASDPVDPATLAPLRTRRLLDEGARLRALQATNRRGSR